MRRMSDSACQSSFAAAALRRAMPWLVVLMIWLLAGWTTLAWLQIDTTPPSWDPSVHLTHALYYWAYLTRMPLAEAYAGLGLTSLYYPPLVHVAGAAAWAIWGVIQPAVQGLATADVPVLANLGFMGLLLYGTYSLAARSYGDTAGMLAALLVACYPILSGQSRLFLLDYPLAACTVAAMALLAASCNLTHPVWVWPLGVAAGAALLCKWSFLLLFAPPLLLALAAGWREVREGRNPALTPVRFIFNVVVVLAGLLVVAGPWYLSHPGATIRELTTSNQTWLLDSDPAVFSPAGLAYYLRALLAEQIFLPFAALAGFGLVLHGLQRDRLAGLGLLGSWLAAGVVVFWLVPNKDPRFTMPLLPALAVLSTSWLAPEPAGRRASPRWRAIRSALLAATVLLRWRSITGGLAAAGLPARIARPGRRCGRFCRVDQRPGALGDLAGGAVGAGHRGGRPARWVMSRAAQHGASQLPHDAATTWCGSICPTCSSRSACPSRAVTPPGQGRAGRAATVESLVADGYDVLLTMDGEQGAHAQVINQTVTELLLLRQVFETAYRLAAERTMPGGEVVRVWVLRAPDRQP